MVEEQYCRGLPEPYPPNLRTKLPSIKAVLGQLSPVRTSRTVLRLLQMTGWHGGKHRIKHIYLLDILHFVHKACHSLTWNYEVARWMDLLRVLHRHNSTLETVSWKSIGVWSLWQWNGFRIVYTGLVHFYRSYSWVSHPPSSMVGEMLCLALTFFLYLEEYMLLWISRIKSCHVVKI